MDMLKHSKVDQRNHRRRWTLRVDCSSGGRLQVLFLRVKLKKEDAQMFMNIQFVFRNFFRWLANGSSRGQWNSLEKAREVKTRPRLLRFVLFFTWKRSESYHSGAVNATMGPKNALIGSVCWRCRSTRFFLSDKGAKN